MYWSRSAIVLFCSLWLLGTSSLSEARSVSGDRLLVLLDDLSDRSQYSLYFDGFENRGYKITYKQAGDASLNLIQYGERTHDHLLHFAPKAKKYGESTINDLMKWMELGGNIVLGVDSSLTESLRDFSAQFGVEFDHPQTMVMNHFSHNHSLASGGRDLHQLLAVTGVNPECHLIVPSVKRPILFQGIGHANTKNPLLTRVLSADELSYSANVAESSKSNLPRPLDEDPVIFGKEIGLISVFQARNNARIAFVGSLMFFSNQFFESMVEKVENGISSKTTVKASNQGFAQELSKWTFHEKGVLRVISTSHHPAQAPQQEKPTTYRIKDEIVYTIVIKSYEEDKFVSFTPTDLQLEIIMLDPYIRSNLVITEQDALSQRLTLPDVYGVFTFHVNYKRLGYTFLEAKDVVAIRPFRHDEYPRFLTAAWPYYASAASMMVGFVFLSAAWLWSKEPSGVYQKKVNASEKK